MFQKSAWSQTPNHMWCVNVYYTPVSCTIFCDGKRILLKQPKFADFLVAEMTPKLCQYLRIHELPYEFDIRYEVTSHIKSIIINREKLIRNEKWYQSCWLSQIKIRWVMSRFTDPKNISFDESENFQLCTLNRIAEFRFINVWWRIACCAWNSDYGLWW